MKKIFFVFLLFLISSVKVFAQVPQLLNYQGVARNAFGNAIPNKQMNIRLSIRNASSTGSVVYSETRLVTTNSGGLYTIQIGSAGASSTIGSLSSVNWQIGSKYLQVELDPEAGNSFIDLGTTQLVSVPYSFISGIANPIGIAGGDLAGSYPNPQVANGAINSIKLADASVSTIKIVDQSVTNPKLADGSVTDSKIVSISGSKVIGNIPGSASNISGVIAIPNGGTGASTASMARTNLGLGNVDNTSDLNKPVSIATQLVLDAKENLSNKSTTTTLGTSDVLYPTQNAVKSYVDAQVASATIADATSTLKGKIQLAGDLSGTAASPTVPGLALKANTSDVTAALALKADAADLTAGLALKENVSNKSTTTTLGTSDVLYPTQNAVKSYVDAQVASATIADATSTLKGKIQLAGDLSGTAASPTVPGLALKANTSDVTAALALKADASDLTAGLALKENLSNKSTTTTLGTSDVLYPTQNAVKSYVDAQVASATIADATSTLKGKIQLAGDLSGTAASPTVPGLALKANTSDVNAALALKANTSDVTAGLALKENLSNKSTTTTLGTSDVLYPTQNAVKSYVDAQVASATIADATSTLKGKIQLAGDLSGTAASPTVPGLALKANTSDVTAALALKADASDLTAGLALKENVSNKSTTTTLGTSDVLYPTQNAVKSYVDAQVASATIADATSTLKGKIQLAGDLSGTAASPTVPGLALKANTSDVTAALALKADASDLTAGLALKENLSNKSTTTTLGTSDVLYPTQNAVKSYVDAQVASATIADATSTLKGKIQLAGDLSGTAASPTVPGLALKANTSDVTAALALKADASDLTAGLALKENLSNKSTTTTLGTSDVLYPTQNAVKSYVDAQVASATIADATSTLKGKIQLAGDLSGTAASPTVPGLALKANTSDVTAGLALKENVSNKSTTTTLGTSDVLYPTQNAVKSYVDAQVASATIADATSTLKGKIQLAGDLSGTAASPTVPGLALKANTSDVTAGLALKENVSNKSTTTTLGTSDVLYPTQNAVKSYVDAQVASATIADATSTLKGKIQLAGDLSGTAASPTVPGLALKANTSDVTAALALKADASDLTAGLALKENVSNKSTTTTLGTSDVLYPTQNAVKTYVDTRVGSVSAITSLNGLSSSTQTFSVGTSGTDVAISSSASTHTFNIPSASSTARGVVTIGAQSFSGVKTFTSGAVVNGTLTAGGTTFPSSTGSTGQVLALSSSGTAAWTSVASVREVADEFSSTAGQTSFTLSQAPNANSKVKMYINGVRISNTAYSVSTSTLTYTPSSNGGYALTAGDRIQFDYYY